ncbi:transcriptional regulator [Pedobacter sp. MW01-1-1]|uniref:transcriptional regulator n=1 Tax=Pedobacter sp. MW01-1-1 TaxID=3383027 RepID=UPI003FEF6418
MEQLVVESDIEVLLMQADLFPEGVLVAHQKLHAKLDVHGERRYYGISYSAGAGKIVYYAAAQQLEPNEAAQMGLKTFTIPKGVYASITIKNFASDSAQVGQAFKQLLQEPALNPNGFCLEMYPNELDIICMVPLLTNPDVD